MPENRYEFYTEVTDFWDAMYAACKDATQTIDLEQYIFLSDAIGSKFVELLKEKSKSGVKVRMILDAVGSASFYTSPVPEELRRMGIEVRFFNVISPWRLHTFTSWFFRDHRKNLVIDRTIGFTGGTGIGDHMKEWRDTNAKILGPVVGEMLGSFEEFWQASHGNNWMSRMRILRVNFKKNFFITNSPYTNKRFLYHTFLDSLRGAQKSIYLTNPYFIPDIRLKRVLRLAASRGVDVKVLIPEKLDVLLIATATASNLGTLLRSGVRIFRYQKRMHHGKIATVDGDWGMFGSFNLDNMSFLYNFEANVVSSDKAFVRTLDSHFEADLLQAVEIQYKDWHNRPLISKVREFFVGFVAGFL